MRLIEGRAPFLGFETSFKVYGELGSGAGAPAPLLTLHGGPGATRGRLGSSMVSAAAARGSTRRWTERAARSRAGVRLAIAVVAGAPRSVVTLGGAQPLPPTVDPLQQSTARRRRAGCGLPREALSRPGSEPG
ncbi:MAG: hypothetical protein ACYDC5_05035 [Candidatus Dormibacteria bacterium]